MRVVSERDRLESYVLEVPMYRPTVTSDGGAAVLVRGTLVAREPASVRTGATVGGSHV